MSFTNLPVDKILKEDGTMNESWSNAFSQLFSFVQTNLSSEGYKFPHQTQENVNKLGTQKSIGNMLFNKDSLSMMLNNAGENFEKIATVPVFLDTESIDLIPLNQINGKWVYNTSTDKLFIGINTTFREIALL